MNASEENVVETETVTLAKSGKRAMIVTINRPHKQNCFNTKVVYSLANIFHQIANHYNYKNCQDDDALAAVIFTGKGTTFCAGADLSDPPNPLEQSSDLPDALFRNPVYQMSQISIPIIGAIQGYCITGGFELALACDILIGDTTVKFRDTHVKFGLAPCWGLSQKLSKRIGPGRAKLISYSARPIDAKEAFSWGLIDELVPMGLSLKKALEIADTIGQQDLKMVQRYKRALEGGSMLDLGRGLVHERALGMAHYLEAVHDGTTFEHAKEYITNESRPRSKL
jgi:enoyl-CoA hydratase/carnithine racemase